MSNDLIFSVLPREGKVPIEREELRVHQIEKEAKLRRLNDEEKELNAEEREAREKYQKKSDDENEKERKEKTQQPEVDPEAPVIDKHGRKHLDIYI